MYYEKRTSYGNQPWSTDWICHWFIESIIVGDLFEFYKMWVQTWQMV